MASEGGESGSVSDIGQLGDEWGFTLHGPDDVEICCFAFHAGADARHRHKSMQTKTAVAVAIASVPQG